MNDKEMLKLLLDSLDELKEKTDENNRSLQGFKIDIERRFGNVELKIEQKMNQAKNGIENSLNHYKEDLNKDIAGFKDCVAKEVSENNTTVRLLKQKIALIVGGISLGVGLLWQLGNFLLKIL